jgi:diguanylate cyclase (GGDEF)-like protein
MMALILLTNQRLIDRLGNAAHRQNQAGVLSRRTFFDSVEPLLESSLANQQPSTIAILGIDNFSEINDTYGGKSGDLALGHVALMVMRILGRQDLLARNKGGEFLVFMYGKTAEQAKTLMNRLQVLLRQNVIDTERGSFQVILNVGIAEHRFDEGVLQTVTRASAALPAMELNDSLQGAG